jgi:phosphotriesterase-related protein
MKTVTTVTGDVPIVSPSSLGFCHCHEHIFISKGRSAEINGALRIDDTDKSISELKDFYRAGGRALVDAQPVGCNRDALRLEEISRAGDVRVIASTGFHKIIFYPEEHWIFRAASEELYGIFKTELTEGMYVGCDMPYPKNITKIRAGLVKTALDACGVTGPYEKLFSAAARAAADTGRTLMVHIERGSDPIRLADFLAASGVRPERTVFCHIDRATDDMSVHYAVCARGIYLEYDTICRPKYHDDEREAEIIKLLLDAGFEDRLTMGLDVTRARIKSYGGTPGLAYIIETFIPLLKKRGVTDAQIRKAFYDNPAEIFSHAV